MRRTIQFAYRAFNNGSLTGAYAVHWTPDIVDMLPEHLAARFRHFIELLANEHNTLERMFRAMMARDDQTFLEGLAELHSGAVGKMSCVVQLSKVAKSSVLRTRGPVGSRFTQEEADLLWQRFAEFDRLLQVDEPHLIPGFQCKEPTTYRFEEMPAMDVDEFIASW